MSFPLKTLQDLKKEGCNSLIKKVLKEGKYLLPEKKK
jgi:hypothetical protein